MSQYCRFLPLFAAFYRFLPLFTTLSRKATGKTRIVLLYDRHKAGIRQVYGRYMAGIWQVRRMQLSVR
ncbi:MAG: hypothetical protein ABI760_22465 [Ferruginibacter sp.]